MKRHAFERSERTAIVLLAVFAAGGCASLPYARGRAAAYRNIVPLQPGEPQIVRGRPYKVLDACDWIWPGSLLGKLFLWNCKVDSHEISPETEAALTAYLRANELKDVKVRLNSYSVVDEFRRTVHNRGVGAGWRYTLGMLAWLEYTILPGRIFGGDHYNPYSNSVNLFSDIPAVTIHEGGHAKDFGGRTWKGTYAFAYMLPFFNLYPEALATGDAVSYLRDGQPLEAQKAGYNILYPAYGTYIGGDAGDWIAFPWNYVAMAGGVIPGHIIGRTRSATLPEPPSPTNAPPSAPR